MFNPEKASPDIERFIVSSCFKIGKHLLDSPEKDTPPLR